MKAVLADVCLRGGSMLLVLLLCDEAFAQRCEVDCVGQRCKHRVETSAHVHDRERCLDEIGRRDP